MANQALTSNWSPSDEAMDEVSDEAECEALAFCYHLARQRARERRHAREQQSETPAAVSLAGDAATGADQRATEAAHHRKRNTGRARRQPRLSAQAGSDVR